MATTISSSTLSVSIKETINLNGQDQGATNNFTISSIKDVYKRIVTCTSGSDCTIAVFKSTNEAGDSAFDLQSVKYIRVTNLDGANSVNLSLQLDSGEDNSAADLSVTHLLEAGRSFVMGTPDEGIHADDDAAAIVTALTDLESIIVDPGSSTGTVEIFIAST